ncbi:hypothetical protein [Anabaena sp. WA102]|uniref:hypothetical protein n=1 Tax=Anabaena sp. WA102 TaxID=1647413 RepID=UPI000AEE7CCE|nr:hypothetical protein [Anabaena sp. WA102]
MKATTPVIIAVNKLFILDNFNSDYLNHVGWVDGRKPNISDISNIPGILLDCAVA